LSSAIVNASASAAIAPVAKIALPAAWPGRGSRRISASVASANSIANTSAAAANGTERSKTVMR
jgi:hypothetical protein